MFTQVLVSHIVAADEAEQAIHHHNLAMVAEVHLEAVEPAATGSECVDLHTAVTQHLAVAGRQGMATDTVVQHEHLHAFGGFA
ncbi:hypothetical protein D3C80_1616950 [compost metagenome]